MLRRKRKDRRVECFEIDARQLQEASRRRPETMPELEKVLAGLGAIPVRAWQQGEVVIYCVEVTYPRLELEEVVQAFARAGLTARRQPT